MGDILIPLFICAVVFIPVMIWSANNDKKKEAEKLETARQTVVKTKFIDSSHTVTQTATPKTGSAIGRAVVGDTVAGPVGAIVGASTAKQKVTTEEKHETTFMVWYSDGTRKHETVANGTELYNFYMDMLDLD